MSNKQQQIKFTPLHNKLLMGWRPSHRDMPDVYEQAKRAWRELVKAGLIS